MTPQETHLQSLLEQLRTRLLVMCVTVEEAVADACAALCEGNAELANAVIDADSSIDELENEVDDMALSLMARSQPVARDLRFVVSALRMVVDLERIGDEATAIAERTLLLREAPQLPAPALTRQMIDTAQKALHDAIIAFREGDASLALQVCRGQDDIVQLEVHLLQNVMRDLTETTNRTDVTGWATLHAILIARSLSRIFGRASNIAEHCYFMKQGVSIKHKKAKMPDHRDGEHQSNPEKGGNLTAAPLLVPYNT